MTGDCNPATEHVLVPGALSRMSAQPVQGRELTAAGPGVARPTLPQI